MSQKVNLAERVVYASKAARVAKASRLGIVVTILLTFLIFAISYYGEKVGNFTFSVDRLASDVGITLYDDSTTKEYTSRLIASKVEDPTGLTAYCGTEYTSYPEGSQFCLPSDSDLTAVEGSHNGTSYIAYTFYLANAGDVAVDLSASINIISSTRSADEAIRVRVIVDDVGTTYAKVQSSLGNNPGEPEPLTEAFYSLTTVMYQEYVFFQPGEVKKVTVVVWYEGEDDDHNLNIIGGGVKMEMDFSVTKTYDSM